MGIDGPATSPFPEFPVGPWRLSGESSATRLGGRQYFGDRMIILRITIVAMIKMII